MGTVYGLITSVRTYFQRTSAKLRSLQGFPVLSGPCLAVLAPIATSQRVHPRPS